MPSQQAEVAELITALSRKRDREKRGRFPSKFNGSEPEANSQRRFVNETDLQCNQPWKQAIQRGRPRKKWCSSLYIRP